MEEKIKEKKMARRQSGSKRAPVQEVEDVLGAVNDDMNLEIPDSENTEKKSETFVEEVSKEIANDVFGEEQEKIAEVVGDTMVEKPIVVAQSVAIDNPKEVGNATYVPKYQGDYRIPTPKQQPKF